MFAQPMDGIAAVWRLPFLPWLTSAVLLIVGIERYRTQYREALSEEL
jgi:hypothetical protein